MTEKLHLSLRLEKTQISDKLNHFAKVNNLTDQQLIDLQCMVEMSIDTIIFKLDNSEQHGSIKRFDNKIF